MVEMLRKKNKELELQYKNKIDKRLEILERVQNSSLQYNRRDTVEISGIPGDTPQTQLEDEVIKNFNLAGVTVEGQKLDKLQIHACHRIGKKGKTIVKTVNRKFAEQGLFCGKNLKGNSPYDTPVYINPSLCDEYNFLNFIIRKAKREGRIHWYKIRKGINSVQMTKDGDFHDITHKLDLIKLGIDVEEYVE